MDCFKGCVGSFLYCLSVPTGHFLKEYDSASKSYRVQLQESSLREMPAQQQEDIDAYKCSDFSQEKRRAAQICKTNGMIPILKKKKNFVRMYK